eukprot:CAMPEP_0119501758 /NCGR_PEP_ID=MMETSP1344-20130328/23474_1 /TAXON_ID=236787 /ORGANISM="Florenciella parvula, Strain CCMP2471" /LENGTH=121 /DNA_ID=CAMNT_0007537931 /DNA_START=77 /DNA_END=439 /DNA_ORIENTATION=+
MNQVARRVQYRARERIHRILIGFVDHNVGCVSTLAEGEGAESPWVHASAQGRDRRQLPLVRIGVEFPIHVHAQHGTRRETEAANESTPSLHQSRARSKTIPLMEPPSSTSSPEPEPDMAAA